MFFKPKLKPDFFLLNRAPQYVCEICGHAFNQEANKIRHVRVVHEHIYDFECKACGKKFSTNYLMQVHAAVCNSRRQGRDRELQNIITKDPLLEDKTVLIQEDKIAQVKNQMEGFDCGTCGESFTKKVDLKRHVEASHDGKYECEICGNNYASLVIKIRHVRVTHELRKDFECLKCGKKFGWHWSLQHHGRSCQGTREAPGPELQKFLQAVANILKVKGQAMQEHREVLNPGNVAEKAEVEKNLTLLEKSEKITEAEECGKRSLQSADKISNKTTDFEKRKDFQCKVCGDKFVKEFTLQRHVGAVHEQNADCKCEICGKTLFSNQKLKLHVRICHTPKNKSKKQRVEVVNLISPGRPGSWPTGITIEANTKRQGEYLEEKIQNGLNQNHKVLIV